MTVNPIIAAIDAGHYQFTVTIEDAKENKGWKAGELRCRACFHLVPCLVILNARSEAGPVRTSGLRKLHNDPLFLPPTPKR